MAVPSLRDVRYVTTQVVIGWRHGLPQGLCKQRLSTQPAIAAQLFQHPITRTGLDLGGTQQQLLG